MAIPTYKLPQPALEFVTRDFIGQTHEFIKPFIVRTPVVPNEYLSKRISEATGHDVKLYFKAELLQNTGAFKVRGALNAVRAAKEARADLPGVVTHSSAATAYAAMKLGVAATIVVPNFATEAKMANMEQYGAEVIKVEPRPEKMLEMLDHIVTTRGYSIIYPYNQKEIMAGQATCAVEFLEDVPQMEALLAPVSGGGLIAGLALGAKHVKPDIKVFGVAPKAKKFEIAINTQVVPDHWSPAQFVETQCDALKAHPGNLTFPIMCELLEKKSFDVTDAQAAAAMKLIWHRMKLTAELSSATVIAALLSDEFIQVVKEQKLTHIGLILSGGNVGLDGEMPWNYLK